MDLRALKSTNEELIDVPLVFNENGDPTDGFKIVGSNSERYQAKERELQQAALRRSANRGRGIDARTQTGAVELEKTIRKQETELAKACVVELYGFTDGAGNPAELNDATLDEIFTAKPTWVTRVLTEARMDRTVFSKP